MAAPPTDPELLGAWLRGAARKALADFAETPVGGAVQRIGRPAAEAVSEGREIGRDEVAAMLDELAAWVREGEDNG